MANALIKGSGFGGVDCDAATATEKYVLNGKTFGKAGSDELATGSMPNKGTTNYTISTNGGSVTIAEGKHSGSGKVTYSLPQFGGATSWRGKTAQQTIETSGKYIPSNIEVQAEPNLKAANIVAGKTIWNTPGSFVDMENTLTLYQNGQYGGWWKDGIVLYDDVQKGSNPAPLLSALQTATNISTANFQNGIGLSDTDRGKSGPPTAASKPQLRITRKSSEYNAHASSSYLLGGVIGYKTADLSFYKTLTVRYTINEMSANVTYMGGYNYVRVYPAVAFANGPTALTQGGTASAVIDSNNKLIEAGPGYSNRITNQSGSFSVNISGYSGHWHIIPLFIIHDTQGATNGNAIYTTDITVNSIILGK